MWKCGNRKHTAELAALKPMLSKMCQQNVSIAADLFTKKKKKKTLHKQPLQQMDAHNQQAPGWCSKCKKGKHWSDEDLNLIRMATHCLVTITLPVNNKEMNGLRAPLSPCKIRGFKATNKMCANFWLEPIYSFLTSCYSRKCCNGYPISHLQSPFKLQTGIRWPIFPGTVGFLVGHSNLSMKGIIVHTGAIDESYTGETAVRITLPTGWQLKAWEKRSNDCYCLMLLLHKTMHFVREDLVVKMTLQSQILSWRKMINHY